MNSERDKPQIGDRVLLLGLPPGFLENLPEEDQRAITAMVGKPGRPPSSSLACWIDRRPLHYRRPFSRRSSRATSALWRRRCRVILCEKVGRDDRLGRDLFVLSIPRPEDLPLVVSLSTPRFVCLLAWDARAATVEEIAAIARRLLNAGAVYICSWGPGCERVHDIIDDEEVGQDPEVSSDSVVMTTWHADESLADTLHFVLTAALPDDPYAEGCGSTLAIAIGSAQWSDEIRDAFSRHGGGLRR